jgi:predicted ATP-dependent protease
MVTITPESLEAIRQELQNLASKRQRLNAQERQLKSRLSRQIKRDRSRRKYVLAEAVEKAMSEDETLTQLVAAALKKRVREHEQFLFPEYWPGATRPKRTGRPPKTETADAPSAEKTKEANA